jgi:hypothetical protein
VQSGGVSSLIFLVVIGVWAAYFIQYWVRRRDHLATARSVDQFSESMRVLERRTPLPAADLSTPTRQAHASAPVQSARAQLLLKRAATPPAAATVGTGVATNAPRPAGGSARGTARPEARSRVTARRNRAMVMLGALSTWLVAVPLVALGMLGAAYLAFPVVSVAIALAWVRRNASSQAGRTAPAGSRSRSTAHDTLASRPGDQRVVRTRPGQAAPTAPVETEAAASNPAATGLAETAVAEPAVAATRVRGELYDLEAIETVNALGAAHAAAALQPTQPTRPLVDEDDIPLTWDPVPVPRPTYTLKARATRPAPAAADLVGDADTEYAAREDELPVRQVAGA